MKVETKIDFGQHQTGKMKHVIREFDGKKYKLSQGFYDKESALERMKDLTRIKNVVLLKENQKGYTPFTVWVAMM